MSPDLHNFESVYYVLGLVVVIAYAWQRFDEPSFPNKETLPQTVEPLRYLFLGPTYRRARLTYLVVSLLLYSLLVLPGPGIVMALRPLGATEANFPVQVWALMVALFLVGLVPNSNIQWLIMIEGRLRRFVHSFFLVPDGTLRTIGVLEDARYDPPSWIRDAVQHTPKARVLGDLKPDAGQLESRWARATLVLELLRQRGGDGNPLKRAAFEPFEKDFEDIRRAYKQLEPEVEKLRRPAAPGKEGERSGIERAKTDLAETDEELATTREDIGNSVDQLMKRMYAYLNWGIRQQAKTEKDLDQILEDLGFRLPAIGRQRVFSDVVFPTALLIGMIGFVWAIVVIAVIPWTRTGDFTSRQIVIALSSATAAGFMYGFGILNALTRRSAQIENKTWVKSSPRCFFSIAMISGLVSWLVIVASTVFWHAGETVSSLIGLWNLARLAGSDLGAGWQFLPIKILTALPWFVAGATASVLVAYLLGGDVRRTTWSDRSRDAMILGSGLGLAAAFSQGIQLSLIDLLQQSNSLTNTNLVVQSATQGLGESAIGAIIGFMVPWAYRRSIAVPTDPESARELRKILDRAQRIRGDKSAAEDWVFQPLYELGGISPAEAIEYKSLINRVAKIMESESPRSEQETTMAPLRLAS